MHNSLHLGAHAKWTYIGPGIIRRVQERYSVNVLDTNKSVWTKVNRVNPKKGIGYMILRLTAMGIRLVRALTILLDSPKNAVANTSRLA